MAAAVILDLKFFKLLPVRHAKKMELLHCTKFRLNGSIGDFFKMTATAILDFSKFQMFNSQNGQECQTASSVPNIVKIARTVPDIREFQY